MSATPPLLRLLHYWAPLGMGASMAVVVHRATGQPFNFPGLALFLCGIVAAYSLDRVVDRTPAGHSRELESVLIVVGALASIGCALAVRGLPMATASLLPIVAAAAIWYPRLKRRPLFKTLIVSAVWTWTAIAFPFGGESWFGWRWVLMPVAAPILMLVASGCLLCDLKDVERDRESHVDSLPVLVGERWTIRIAMLLATAAALTAAAQHRPGLVVGSACLSLLALRPALLARDAVGPLIVDATLAVPGVLIAAHIV